MLRRWMNEIESDSDAMLAEPIKNAELLRVRLCAGDFVGGFFLRALEAELNVIETSCDQCGEFLLHPEAGLR